MEPAQGPERQSFKGPGLRHLLESRVTYSLGTVPTTGLSPLPEQAQELIADPPAHWGCSSSASGTDRAYDAKLLPTVALCIQSMAHRGASHMFTCKDILGPLKDLWCSSPSFRDPLRAHTSCELRWTLNEDEVMWRTIPPLTSWRRGKQVNENWGLGRVTRYGGEFGKGEKWQVYL
ncbi:Hypothetical predicted protein [Marmota monax]|uniref:Uncharacterized protein n=1 Tax=Marmota monax TaxID=9995 RepID=A0A5E4B6Q3_MARMO|nr:hypothetical protein GHT09_019643 [Marmota monax]VTJ64551.1 Hypothetical predicted protein [Marmota monax]